MEILSDFGQMVEQGGATLTIDPEIQRVKFAKNFWNTGFSAFSTLTSYTLPAIFREPPAPDSTATYSPYTSPITAELIKRYTIPSVYAILRELLVLGIY
jgi:2-dehydropantoate 2-reductase